MAFKPCCGAVQPASQTGARASRLVHLRSDGARGPAVVEFDAELAFDVHRTFKGHWFAEDSTLMIAEIIQIARGVRAHVTIERARVCDVRNGEHVGFGSVFPGATLALNPSRGDGKSAPLLFLVTRVLHGAQSGPVDATFVGLDGLSWQRERWVRALFRALDPHRAGRIEPHSLFNHALTAGLAAFDDAGALDAGASHGAGDERCDAVALFQFIRRRFPAALRDGELAYEQLRSFYEQVSARIADDDEFVDLVCTTWPLVRV